ncbi:conserved hypothetical protein [Gammaproteobacteria bacterium]
MWFSKSKSSAEHKVSTQGLTQQGISLYVHLGAMGWRVQAFDAAGISLKLPNVGESILPVDDNESHTERMLRMALEGIPSSLRKRITHCYLLWDSKDLIFTDTKLEALRSASPARAREFGCDLFNCREVAFGHTLFRIVHQEGRSNGLYAFVDTTLLRRILVGLGDIAPKVREIVPTEALLLKEAEAHPTEPYGALLIGAEYTKILFAHVEIGAVTVRHIPVGIAALITAIARKTGTRPEEVLGALKDRDYLSVLVQGHGADDHSLSPQEQALLPLLRKLNDEIISTLEYFRSQRACGSPSKISIFGEVKRIRGLDTWLLAGLPEGIQGEIKGSTEVLFDTFIKRLFPIALNLLKGTEGPLVSVGKAQYAFNEKEGMVLSSRAATNVNKGVSGTNTRAARARSKRAAQAKEGIFAKLAGMFGNQETEGSVAGEDINANTYFALLGLFACGLLYIGYDQYATLDRSFRSLTNIYAHNFDENNNLRQKIQSQGVISAVANGLENKVLWTEKFLAIGNHITDNLWLTDIYLEGNSHSGGKNVLSSAKLIMKGAALPRTDGHVGVIADFVEALIKDESMFMSDFKEISFGGFVVDTSDADPVVRFLLEAHYDPSKRKATTTTPDSGNPIANMKQIVEKRNLAIEQATGVRAH